MTKDETSKYTDLMADGKAWQFTWAMDAKSVITFPSGGQQLPSAGPYEISGLAWSGRGAIRRVEVSIDGGKSWQDAVLQEPILPMAFTRFRLPWRWDGVETTMLSRCTDETGYVQPTREDLIARTRPQFALPLQLHHGLARAGRREGDQCRSVAVVLANLPGRVVAFAAVLAFGPRPGAGAGVEASHRPRTHTRRDQSLGHLDSARRHGTPRGSGQRRGRRQGLPGALPGMSRRRGERRR